MRALKLTVTPRLPITEGALNWLIFCLLLVMAYHIPHIPVWATLTALIIALWRLKAVKRGNPIPSRALRFVLTGAAIAGVLITYRSFLGRDPGITALILLSTLKLLELKTQRDFMFIVFLCYFLVLGNFLYTQSIPALLFMAAAVIFITAAILRLNRRENERVKASALLKSAAKLVLLSLPFMLILFFLFPRTTGPLWNLPQDPEGKFRSGFSDSVYPGQIAQLATSPYPAFRVTFPDRNMPHHRELYFRGVILWFTNGRGWFQAYLPAGRPTQLPESGGAVIRQVFTLEPHYRRWLFALDMPIVIPRWSRELPGRIFRTWRIVERYLSYEVVSQLNYRQNEPLDDKHRRWALQLPRNLSPKITELAMSWRDKASSDEDIVNAALDYFKASFTYTLKPGLMDRQNPFADFLFNKRRGFCEHFAGAFTLLMRAAEIPTRIVTGYMGGEYNKVGKYLLVRQSEAHAWCEVRLQGKGWQRVDPTASVSPERIEYGLAISDSISSIDAADESGRSDAVRRALSRNFFKQLLETLGQYWDTINNKWNLWIMSYDLYRQRSFLKGIGIHDRSWLTLIVIIGLVIAFLLFLISYLLRRKSSLSHPLLELYLQFCSKLGRAGVRRFSWEGPLDFEKRALAEFPQRAEEIERVTGLFVKLRYGKLAVDEQSLKQLKKYITKLKISKSKP
jgi:transglutaminase-like putative cysteine protease